jgi:hypothetical protein
MIIMATADAGLLNMCRSFHTGATENTASMGWLHIADAVPAAPSCCAVRCHMSLRIGSTKLGSQYAAEAKALWSQQQGLAQVGSDLGSAEIVRSSDNHHMKAAGVQRVVAVVANC